MAFFIPPLIFPCSHFLDSGGKQVRLKEEGGLKKNKQNKKKNKLKKARFFLYLVKKLPLRSFEISSSYYPECHFDAGFCLESLLQDGEGCCVGNETSPSGNERAASGYS